MYSRTTRTRTLGQITSEVRQEPRVPRLRGLQAAHTAGVHHKRASHQHCVRGQAAPLLPRTRAKGVVMTSNCYRCFWRSKLAGTFHTCFFNWHTFVFFLSKEILEFSNHEIRSHESFLEEAGRKNFFTALGLILWPSIGQGALLPATAL